MTSDAPWTGDPLILQAEKIFAQRQTRSTVIAAELLGEPGWDILLMAFIASGKGGGCERDAIAAELGLSETLMHRWIDLLVCRGMLEVSDSMIVLTDKAERKMRKLFSAQLQDLLRDIAKIMPYWRNEA